MPRQLTDEEKNINAETMRHILTLRTLVAQCSLDLLNRGNHHDLTKLQDPEVSLFAEYTPKLKDVEYGSEDYKTFLRELKPALDHHYAHNSHHPEHFIDGIEGMTLLDLLEMMCDWKASSLRGKNGDLMRSLVLQKEKLGISDQLFKIMENTAVQLNIMALGANAHVSYPGTD